MSKLGENFYEFVGAKIDDSWEARSPNPREGLLGRFFYALEIKEGTYRRLCEGRGKPGGDCITR